MILQIQKLEKIKADFDGIDIHYAYLTLLNEFYHLFLIKKIMNIME